MKSIFIFFICVICSNFGSAQNISGRWEGYLDQSAGASSKDGYKDYWERGLWKKGTKTHDLQLTFTYNERRKKYTGEYYINEAIKKAHFARFAITATVSSNQEVRYSTTSKIFETKNTLNLGFCYNQATLIWSEDDKYEYLEGKWRGWNDQKRACAPAHIWVRRKKRSYQPPKPEPPVVAKKEIPKPVPPLPPTPPVVKKDTVVKVPTDTIVQIDSIQQTQLEEEDYSNRKIVTKETIHVPKDSIWVHLWDSNREDGDIITLTFNGQVLIQKYTLTTTKKKFRVALRAGDNILTLIAHNLGDIPPNTAAIEVEREEGRKLVVLESDMDTSESIKIIKE